MLPTSSKRPALLAGLTVIVVLLWAPIAQASSIDIYKACRDGSSMGGFSKAQLQAALGGVPSDLDEYYSCSAQINAAIISKSVKRIPGAKGVKGARAQLRAAGVDDLTTPAERKRALDKATKATAIDRSSPLGAASDPTISTAGKTLASSSAPGTPIALVIGLLGLVALLGLDFAGRFRKSQSDAGAATGPPDRGDS
jgi:hypothetical protein